MFAIPLLWGNAAQAAEKTITAHIEMDSQLGTTKIEDDTDADARVVIDGLQDDPDQNAPGAKFTYSWSLITTGIPATLPDVDAATNTLSTEFDIAGEYPVKFKVDIEFESGTGDDTWHGTATKEITQKVIGGPIDGDTMALFYCMTDSPLFNASVSDNQPVGTTYTWSMSKTGAGQIEFMDPETASPVTFWGGTGELYSQIHFRGRAGSNPGSGDVILKVTYSIGDVSVDSNSLIIFVSKPTELNNYEQIYTDSTHIYYKNDPLGNNR